MSRSLRVRVDHDLCVGYGQCVRTAEGVFRHNAERQSEVVDPQGAAEDVILAAASQCPAAAIEVVDDETGEALFP